LDTFEAQSESVRPKTLLREKTFQLRTWSLTVSMLGCTAALQLFGLFFPWTVERIYTAWLYPPIASSIGRLSCRVRFSIAEILFLAIVICVGFAISRLVWELVRRQRNWRSVFRTVSRRFAFAFSALLLGFTLVWGLNYRRPPLADTMGFDRNQPSTDQLEQVARGVIDGINENYALSYGSGSLTPAQVFASQAELADKISTSYKRAELLPGPVARDGYSTPKPLLFARVVARFGISGIYSPLTAEPNYLGIMPEFDIPATMAHEMAHARGFAREDEAEFAGFVACVTSDDPRLRYSGYLAALRVLGPLYLADRDRYRSVLKLLGEGPRNDLKARAEFWARYTGRASAMGTAVNNLYLRANGVRSGIKNYNESTWLMIKYLSQQKHAFPI
jgi:Protein of unknown function (DUF3810)